MKVLPNCRASRKHCEAAARKQQGSPRVWRELIRR
jgi:hypothetical protein